MLSVVTLVRNRNEMLHGLLRGLDGQTDRRFELIVVQAGGQQDPARIVELFPDLPTSIHRLDLDDDDPIPYSRARNLGSACAIGEHLAFCDADTIATRGFVANVHRTLDERDAIVSGDVLYLPPVVVADHEVGELEGMGRPHPARERPPASGVRLDARHELLWGLCMAMRGSTFDRAGGFDEHYGGYAGEDTDLAVTCRELGVPAGLVADAAVLHQHHDSFDPPVQQLVETLANAQHFHDKWGEWPMQGWLAGFERMGLVERTGARAVVVRMPTVSEIESCRQRCAAPFRSDAGT
jgi:GT2 family glycosyltransferase